MTLLRKIVFYLFVLAYLIICPQNITRMLGYIQDPHTHQWVKTGIIYISSNPPQAQVFINGRRAPETTPCIIRDLTPGNYTMRMELNGYETWENTVPVVDKKATSVENILLIPHEWKITSISPIALSKLIIIPDNNYLLAAVDDTAKNIYILRPDKDPDEKLELLFPEESIYRDGRVMQYFTVKDSPFFVMQIDFSDKHKYLWIDPRDKQVHIEDISDLLPQAPVRLFWEPNDDKNLYAFYPNAVNHLNIKAKAIFPNIADKDIPVEKKTLKIINAPVNDQAFLINNDNTLLFRKGPNVFLTDEEDFGKPRITKFLKVKEDTDIFFSEKTDKLYYIDAKTKVLSTVQVLHHKPFIPKPIAETLRLKKLEQ